MGFPIKRARIALEAADNDVAEAAYILSIEQEEAEEEEYSQDDSSRE